VLARAQDLGFLGPGALAGHVRHAIGFAEVFESVLAGAGQPGAGPPAQGPPGQGPPGENRAPGPEKALDLGSGGGLPGLVLARRWPATAWLLVDSNQRRAAFLATAVDRLGLAGQVQVAWERAEVAARVPAWRSAFQLVVARSFGPPAVTAECAAGFLGPGGHLVVSEPPDSTGARWTPAGLEPLGQEPDVYVRRASAGYQVICQRRPCPDRFPRRSGVPLKRPLF